MNFVPTPSQKEAISATDQDLAVTAGAGSGKTRVLAERYLNVLGQGVQLDQIAAVTFTKKAAQEMKERLRKTRPELAEDLEKAQISTIHSLCQRIIEEHPREAKIDPRFRVGEEWEMRVLLQQVIEAETEDCIPPEGLGRPQEIRELILNLYQQMQARGDFCFQQETELEVDYGGELVQLQAAVEEFLQLTPTTVLQKDTMESWAQEWPMLRSSLFSEDQEFQLETLEILENYLKNIRGGLALQTSRVKKKISFIKECIAQKRGAEVISWCAAALEKVHRGYKEKKRLLGVLDFADLEFAAHFLLQNPEVKANYNFRHLMVDEFQDTNPLQKKIIDALAGDQTRLFIVGDPKQSIYRFRGADLNVFLKARKEIKKKGKEVFLAENFRSRPEIVSFTNNFFKKVMSGDPVGYQSSNFRREPVGKPCLSILRIPAPGLTLQDARLLEAQQIALKIRSLVDQGLYNYEDISILFRVMTNVRFYEQALQKAEIPYVNLSGRGFYSRQEIQDVLHYFSWLEDEENEIARLAVLRSPFYLLSDEGLYWVRKGLPARLSAREREALRRSRADYSTLRGLMAEKTAPEVISAMFESTDYLEKTWRLPFGAQKKANIEKLLEQSWDLYARDLVSVPEQLRYIRLAAESSEREGEAALDLEHADVVILRTIHVAKGLEFPVVFLADTNGRLIRSRGERVLYHPDCGLTYKGLKSYKVLKEKQKQEELSEAKRLLYVAITRAEEELFWCGLDGPKESNSWWNWLQEVLPEIPGDLYREIEAEEEWPQEKKALFPEKQVRKLTKYNPLPPQHNQVSFSVTALMSYARCPRYYYFRYVLGVPENFGLRQKPDAAKKASALSALERGNIVHRVCEQITDQADLPSLVDYAASMEGVRLRMEEKAQLERIIIPYLQSSFFQRVTGIQKGWQIYKEKEFTRVLDAFVISGMIDQVFVNSKEIEVVDFKSNWIRKNRVLEEGRNYQVQLRLYAWAMEREFGLPVSKSQAYFLIPNKIYSLPAENLAVAETEQWIMQACQTIVAGASQGLEAFPTGEDCLNCGYQPFCAKSREFGKNTDEIGKKEVSP